MQAKTLKYEQKRAVVLTPLALFLFAQSSIAETIPNAARGIPNAWRHYAASQLGFEPVPPPATGGASVRAAVDARLQGWDAFSESKLSEQTSVQVRGMFEAPRGATTRLVNEAVGGLSETIISPAFVQRLGNGGEVAVNGLFAYQSFATPGLGQVSIAHGDQALAWGGLIEQSSGFGLGLEYAHPLSDVVSARLGAQSSVAMEPFQNYRGAFGDPARFDLPSSVRAGLALQVASRHTFLLGVERVHYSAIAPFLPNDLPDRVLSRLGDRSSPEFRWRDLTVYSARWAWEPAQDARLELRYSTQLQPEPTAEVLREALASSYTDRNFGLAWSQRLTRDSGFALSASYSPFSYFTSPALFRRETREGDQVEFEASYRFDF
jgi:hypothetical protein